MNAVWRWPVPGMAGLEFPGEEEDPGEIRRQDTYSPGQGQCELTDGLSVGDELRRQRGK